MTLGSVMKETTRILPPQFLQISGSVLNTRRMGLAHRRRRVLRFVALSSSSPGCWSIFSGMFSCASGVAAVVQDGMLIGLGNVDEHPGEELERVEELGLSVF